MSTDKTVFFDPENESSKKAKIKETLKEVYAALLEKGYNPNNQLVGYIISGDPTYITNHKKARILISEIDRDELLEEMLKTYLELD